MAKKIMWDGGHGGHDPGAVGNGIQEKNIVLAIVNAAMKHLSENYTGFEQSCTRSTDVFVKLSDRAKKANNYGADAFVSVHINSSANPTSNGFETFVYTKASSGSKVLQNHLHADILKTINGYGTIKDRGKKNADYAVVRETKMPAVLTEILFINNPKEASLLKQKEFIDSVGQAHAVAVAKFLSLKEKVSIATEEKGTFRLMSGAFSTLESAEKVANEIKNIFNIHTFSKMDDKKICRFYTGAFSTKEAAEKAIDLIKTKFKIMLYIKEG